MSKNLTHAGWCNKCTIQTYNQYLDKALEKGQISQLDREMYHNSTNKKNSKSIFGPITF